MDNSQIQLYTSADGQVQLEISLDQDTVWLTHAQMCELFDKNKRTVSEHIRNISREGELEEEAVVRKFRTIATEAWRDIDRLIELKQAKPYQKATQLLRDLYDLSQREKRQETFQNKLQALREQHGKKRSFWERVQGLGLG